MYNAHRRAILSGSLSPSSSLVRAHQTGITLQQNEGVTTEGGEKSSKKKNDGEDDERVMIVVRWAVALDHKIRFLKTRLDFIPLSLSFPLSRPSKIVPRRREHCRQNNELLSPTTTVVKIETSDLTNGIVRGIRRRRSVE